MLGTPPGSEMILSELAFEAALTHGARRGPAGRAHHSIIPPGFAAWGRTRKDMRPHTSACEIYRHRRVWCLGIWIGRYMQQINCVF